MKHEWEWAPNPEHPLGNECRRCVLCKAFQCKEDNPTWYMRKQGFKWRPLVGRCKGKPNETS